MPDLDYKSLKITDKESIPAHILFGMNIVVWMMQQGVFVMLGVLFFNTVYQSYEKFYKDMPMRMYKSKAKFNNECYDIVDMFVRQRNFKVITFAIAKNLKSQSSDDWKGMSNEI